jgi:hypothetical protein
MATTQQIVVLLNQTSLTALKELGYALYALQAFQTTNAEGKAMVWSATTTFENSTALMSTMEYAAYVSTTSETGGTVITASIAKAAALGDIATFADNTLTISGGGYAKGVTIVNTTTTPYIAGLSAANPNVAGNFSPLVAVPLYGLAEDILAPLDTFLVTFSTAGTALGGPLPYSMSQSLLIDMTGQVQVEASFDINTGWSFNDAAWGKTVPAGADLFAALVKEAPLTGEV